MFNLRIAGKVGSLIPFVDSTITTYVQDDSAKNPHIIEIVNALAAMIGASLKTYEPTDAVQIRAGVFMEGDAPSFHCSIEPFGFVD